MLQAALLRKAPGDIQNTLWREKPVDHLPLRKEDNAILKGRPLSCTVGEEKGECGDRDKNSQLEQSSEGQGARVRQARVSH